MRTCHSSHISVLYRPSWKLVVSIVLLLVAMWPALPVLAGASQAGALHEPDTSNTTSQQQQLALSTIAARSSGLTSHTDV